MPELKGQVQKVSFELLGGKVILKGIRLDVQVSGDTTRIEAREAESRLHLGQLIHGRVEADVDVIRPSLEYFQKTSGPKKSHESNIRPRFRIDALRIREGTLRIQNETKSPAYALTADHINADITNISNSRKLTDSLFASFDITAILMKSGKAHLSGRFNPVHRPPEFRLDILLEALDLSKLNPLLTAQENIQIKQGTFSLDSEVASQDGEVDGYFKSTVKDLQVSDLKKDIKKGPGHAIKEKALDIAEKATKNQTENGSPARVPFHEKLHDPNAGVIAEIGSTLRKIFIQALVPNKEAA